MEAPVSPGPLPRKILGAPLYQRVSLKRFLCPPTSQIHDHITRRAGRRTLPQIRTAEAGRRRLLPRSERVK